MDNIGSGNRVRGKLCWLMGFLGIGAHLAGADSHCQLVFNRVKWLTLIKIWFTYTVPGYKMMLPLVDVDRDNERYQINQYLPACQMPIYRSWNLKCVGVDPAPVKMQSIGVWPEVIVLLVNQNWSGKPSSPLVNSMICFPSRTGSSLIIFRIWITRCWTSSLDFAYFSICATCSTPSGWFNGWR